MKRKIIAIINLITAIVLALFMMSYAFAWLAEDGYKKEFPFGGSSGNAYFASGDGKTAATAFVITDKYHLYNLAWLQNTGRFGDTYYYFKLGDNITELDLTGVWLPPIGNAEHPFMGDFNGNGKTIKGLQITTNKGKLTSCPILTDENYEFSKSVGMFGMTKNKNDSTVCNIHNFIMDGVIVEVASTNTQDSDNPVAVKYASATNASDGGAAAGLAVGHVAGKVSSIGVLADSTASASAILDMQVTNKGYSTFNSIIGELAENATASVTGGGHTGAGGSGNAYGASFDVETMLDRLQKIHANKNSATPSWLLPDIDTQSDNPLPAPGEKMPFTVTDESTYTGSTAKEVVADVNVGYYLGNQNKINTKKLTFCDPLVPNENVWSEWTFANGTKPSAGAVPRAFYTISDPICTGIMMKTAQGFGVMSDEDFAALPPNVQNIIPSGNVEETFTTIRLQQTYSNAGIMNYGNLDNDKWSYHGQISWMGNTYGEGFSADDGTAVDINGNHYQNQYGGNAIFNSYEGGILLPNNAIWFKPANEGKFRFVVYTQSDNDGFTLLRVERANATAEDPFRVLTSWGNLTDSGDLLVTEIIKQQGLPKYVMYYFEYDATEDVQAGNIEYMLMEYGNNGAFFVYLDIGSSAAEDVDNNQYDPTVDVSAVDFIYDGVTISTDENETTHIRVGDFVVGAHTVAAKYEATATSVYFEELNSALRIVYVRLYGRSDKKTMYVTSTPVTTTLILDTKSRTFINVSPA